MSTYNTPLVRKLAAEHGVDVAAIAGTGAGGRVTAADVRAAAPGRSAPGRSAPSAARPMALAPAAPRRMEERRSAWSNTKVKVDVYARNPLVDDARQATPKLAAAALSEEAPPTLFAAGDLPVWLASGADPQLLMQLPWVARHAAAEADTPTLAKMLDRYAGDGWSAAELKHVMHSGNREYRGRVDQWLSGRNHAAPFGKDRTPERQAADAETYDAIFGAQEATVARAKQMREEDAAARKAEEKARNERARRKLGYS